MPVAYPLICDCYRVAAHMQSFGARNRLATGGKGGWKLSFGSFVRWKIRFRLSSLVDIHMYVAFGIVLKISKTD